MNEIVVDSLLKNATRPLLSLEFFPPKTYLGFGLLGGAIEQMRSIHPDFVSVTYGSGAGARGRALWMHVIC